MTRLVFNNSEINLSGHGFNNFLALLGIRSTLSMLALLVKGSLTKVILKLEGWKVRFG